MQLAIWNSIVIMSKIILFVLEFFLRRILEGLSQFLLGWIEAYPKLELVFVLIVVPVIMNGFAFWVQDNFLKKRDLTSEVREVEAEIEMKKTEKEQTEEQMREHPEKAESPDKKSPEKGSIVIK